MNILPIVSCFLLAYCSAAPTGEEFNIVVSDNFFKKGTVLYTGQHDIVNIFVPFDQFDLEQYDKDIEITGSTSSTEDVEKPRIVFFVEADKNNGINDYKGLYVYVNGNITKLLDNGRDIIETRTNDVYLAASDGIYKYNRTTNSAVKYGTVTENVIQLAYYNVTDVIYYLTANHEVFKLNPDGSAGVKVSNINDVQEFAFGYRGHIYYRDSGNNVYVLNDTNGVPKKFVDLPSKINKIKLIGAAYGIDDEVLLIVNENLYFLGTDATSKRSSLKLEVEPTAYEPRATLIQFFAKDKKLYEFNMIAIMLESVMDSLKSMYNTRKSKSS